MRATASLASVAADATKLRERRLVAQRWHLRLGVQGIGAGGSRGLCLGRRGQQHRQQHRQQRRWRSARAARALGDKHGNHEFLASTSGRRPLPQQRRQGRSSTWLGPHAPAGASARTFTRGRLEADGRVRRWRRLRQRAPGWRRPSARARWPALPARSPGWRPWHSRRRKRCTSAPWRGRIPHRSRGEGRRRPLPRHPQETRGRPRHGRDEHGRLPPNSLQREGPRQRGGSGRRTPWTQRPPLAGAAQEPASRRTACGPACSWRQCTWRPAPGACQARCGGGRCRGHGAAGRRLSASPAAVSAGRACRWA